MRLLSDKRPYKRGVYPRFEQQYGSFYRGNQFSKAENMSAESNARRIAGLCKSWEKQVQESYLPMKAKMAKERNRFRRTRIQLRTTVAREAREIQEMARTHATQAMKRMAEIVNDPMSPDNIAVAAAEVIFNRAYGKPNQTNTNLNVDANGKLTEISSAELNQRVKEALERIEAIAGRSKQAASGKKQPADLRKLDRNTHGPDEPVH